MQECQSGGENRKAMEFEVSQGGDDDRKTMEYEVHVFPRWGDDRKTMEYEVHVFPRWGDDRIAMEICREYQYGGEDRNRWNLR